MASNSTDAAGCVGPMRLRCLDKCGKADSSLLSFETNGSAVGRAGWGGREEKEYTRSQLASAPCRIVRMVLSLRNELVSSLRPAFEHLIYAACWMLCPPRSFNPYSLIRHQLTKRCALIHTNMHFTLPQVGCWLGNELHGGPPRPLTHVVLGQNLVDVALQLCLFLCNLVHSRLWCWLCRRLWV